MKFLDFLSCINDCIEDMATFTALVKVYSTEYFCIARIAVLGNNYFLSSENFGTSVLRPMMLQCHVHVIDHV